MIRVCKNIFAHKTDNKREYFQMERNNHKSKSNNYRYLKNIIQLFVILISFSTITNGQTIYIADTVTWAAIGARTTESQTHRQMASGLSMPVGFKNATDGTVQAALDAIKAASAHHSFIGLTEDGQAGIFRTKGNAFGHIVLRGGDRMPNFAAEHIAFTKVAHICCRQ